MAVNDSPKKLLITGAKGLLGYQLSAFAQDVGFMVHAYDQDKLDISNQEQVKFFLSKIKPDIILNCAVIGPQASQFHPDEAAQTNIHGVKYLLKHKLGARLIHFSSPAVFDGQSALEEVEYVLSYDLGFQENSPTHAMSVYGKTKIESEKILQNTDSLIIRTSWLYSHSRPFGLFTSQQFPVNDIGRPTHCQDIWEFIIIALEEKLGGLFHVCGSEVMSRNKQAEIFYGKKFKPEILPTPSIRPLSIDKIRPHLDRHKVNLTSWKSCSEKT